MPSLSSLSSASSCPTQTHSCERDSEDQVVIQLSLPLLGLRQSTETQTCDHRTDTRSEWFCWTAEAALGSPALLTAALCGGSGPTEFGLEGVSPRGAADWFFFLYPSTEIRQPNVEDRGFVCSGSREKDAYINVAL